MYLACSLHSRGFRPLLTKTMHIYRIPGYIACKLQTTFGFAARLFVIPSHCLPTSSLPG